MSKYLLQQKSFDKLVSIDLKNGLTFSSAKINNIVVYDGRLAQKICIKKFSSKYLKICQLLKNDDEQGGNGCKLIIDEIDRLIELLINNYVKFLDKEIYSRFLNDILNIKKITINKYKLIKENRNEYKRR